MSNTGKTRRTSKLADDTIEAGVQTKNQEGEKSDKILLDELISVMSLLSYPLNLSTEKGGQGRTVRFDSFGQIKKIMYGTLIDMMETNGKFMEWGYFFILDPRVIRSHGLQEIYEKILTKDKIEEILSGNKNGLELYNSCNPEQKKVIIEMVIDKVKVNPDFIDLNLVDKLSRLSGVDILKKAEDSLFYAKDKESEPLTK
jgi:hypothetical protein